MHSQSQPPIWHHYMHVLQTAGVTAEPWGRDRIRVVILLAEIYRLGERPSRREVAAHLADQYGPNDSLYRRTILDLWSKRLRSPHGRWRGSESWKYPFIFAHEYVRENDLPSVAGRLANVADDAAAALATAIDNAPATDEAYAAADELRAATYALDLWHLVQDRPDEDWIGAQVVPPRRSLNETQSIATRRGRQRNPYTKDRPPD
jgi:hypothetical protein